MTRALTHSPARIMRQLLIDLSLGEDSTTEEWSVFYSLLPDTPDNVIVATSTAGVQDGRDQTTGEVAEHRGITITVRNANPDDGHEKADAIAAALAESVVYRGVNIGSNGYIVQAINKISGPIAIGKEVPESKRNLFTINVLVSLRQVT